MTIMDYSSVLAYCKKACPIASFYFMHRGSAVKLHADFHEWVFSIPAADVNTEPKIDSFLKTCLEHMERREKLEA